MSQKNRLIAGCLIFLTAIILFVALFDYGSSRFKEYIKGIIKESLIEHRAEIRQDIEDSVAAGVDKSIDKHLPDWLKNPSNEK